MIAAEAVEAAVQRSWHLEITTSDVQAILEAAAPHMSDEAEDKLAAIIVALDPFERAPNGIGASDEAGCRAFEAVRKIRAILDTP